MILLLISNERSSAYGIRTYNIVDSFLTYTIKIVHEIVKNNPDAIINKMTKTQQKANKRNQTTENIAEEEAVEDTVQIDHQNPNPFSQLSQSTSAITTRSTLKVDHTSSAFSELLTVCQECLPKFGQMSQDHLLQCTAELLWLLYLLKAQDNSGESAIQALVSFASCSGSSLTATYRAIMPVLTMNQGTKDASSYLFIEIK